MTAINRCRSVWISDTHLGTRSRKVDFLRDFLRHNESDYPRPVAPPEARPHQRACSPRYPACNALAGAQLRVYTLPYQQIIAMANHNQEKGIKRICNAALYSVAGIRATFQTEAAFRQELILCVIFIPLAFWVGTTAVERALLIASCLLVLVTELLNSAIEAVVDRIGAERNELSGKAKDIGSAAVFISLWTAGIIWVLIGYQRFIDLGV